MILFLAKTSRVVLRESLGRDRRFLHEKWTSFWREDCQEHSSLDQQRLRSLAMLGSEDERPRQWASVSSSKQAGQADKYDRDLWMRRSHPWGPQWDRVHLMFEKCSLYTITVQYGTVSWWSRSRCLSPNRVQSNYASGLNKLFEPVELWLVVWNTWNHPGDKVALIVAMAGGAYCALSGSMADWSDTKIDWYNSFFGCESQHGTSIEIQQCTATVFLSGVDVFINTSCLVKVGEKGSWTRHDCSGNGVIHRRRWSWRKLFQVHTSWKLLSEWLLSFLPS